ncbi:MAG: type II toxin-antitoxin system HicA family toxin [SAR324 cluster bacterium]|nr:type II toxin-antitoxin system HicA family toxin [SAR324 cluster bacterium]
MKLPRGLSGAEVVKSLQRLGFTVVRQTGSHVRLAKGSKRITVPMHRFITVGTLQSILRQAGVGLEEFLESL